jgi:BTB/POZ domain
LQINTYYVIDLCVVCATDADIVLRSSDNVLFKVHRKNLELHSDIFADGGIVSGPETTSTEVVQLSETSTVLDLLLQFMYRQPQPNLGEVDFETLDGVAEAAEKYKVHAAITVCSFYMR